MVLNAVLEIRTFSRSREPSETRNARVTLNTIFVLARSDYQRPPGPARLAGPTC